MTETCGIIVCGEAPDHLVPRFGRYADMFMAMLRRCRPELNFRVFEAFKDEIPGSPAEADIWLLTGSRFSVLDDAPWMQRLQVLIRDMIAFDSRLIGICFGHQLIARALGGRVERSHGGWLAGRQAYSSVRSTREPGTAIAMNAFHEDQVVKPPEHARVLAGSDTCPYAVLQYGTSVITTQAHPEFSDEFIAALIRHRLSNRVAPGVLDGFLAGLRCPVDHDAVCALVFEPVLSRSASPHCG